MFGRRRSLLDGLREPPLDLAPSELDHEALHGTNQPSHQEDLDNTNPSASEIDFAALYFPPEPTSSGELSDEYFSPSETDTATRSDDSLFVNRQQLKDGPSQS